LEGTVGIIGRKVGDGRSLGDGRDAAGLLGEGGGKDWEEGLIIF